VLGQAPLTPRARVDRFTEFLDVLDRILREESVTSHGSYYTVVDARGRPGCVQSPRVPFVVAATGPRSMRLAARYDAWVTTGTRSDTRNSWWASVAEAAHRFDHTLEAAGRDPTTIDRYLMLDPASPVYSLSSAAYFADALAQAAEYGFTDAITYWPRPAGWYAGDEAILDTIAADVLPKLSPG
jgi:alkanesulfonate monooxygenase SsuD/methylene tetrahydromethanopterin reductase-like flavin-dependent oxidoreductase (luciferase family)